MQMNFVFNNLFARALSKSLYSLHTVIIDVSQCYWHPQTEYKVSQGYRGNFRFNELQTFGASSETYSRTQAIMATWILNVIEIIIDWIKSFQPQKIKSDLFINKIGKKDPSKNRIRKLKMEIGWSRKYFHVPIQTSSNDKYSYYRYFPSCLRIFLEKPRGS